MDAKLKTQWVKALRSGKYKQGSGALYDAGKYCCIGVLCRVAGGKVHERNSVKIDDKAIHYLLTPALRERFGLPESQELALAHMNDGLGVQKKNFSEIASYIEANL